MDLIKSKDLSFKFLKNLASAFLLCFILLHILHMEHYSPILRSTKLLAIWYAIVVEYNIRMCDTVILLYLRSYFLLPTSLPS